MALRRSPSPEFEFLDEITPQRDDNAHSPKVKHQGKKRAAPPEAQAPQLSLFERFKRAKLPDAPVKDPGKEHV